MDDLYVIVLSAGVGLVAAWVRGYVDYTQTAIRELRVSALACLDCLEKLAEVRACLPEAIGDNYEELPRKDARRQSIDNEFQSLGPRLDNYLKAIGGARWGAWRKHFPIYQGIRPVLIQHQFQPIEGLTRKLREETRLAH